MGGLIALPLAVVLTGAVVWGTKAALRRANLGERLSDEYELKHQASISPGWGAVIATAGGLGIAASTFITFANPPGQAEYPHHTIIGTPSGLILIGLGFGTVGAAWTAALQGTARWTTLGLGVGATAAWPRHNALCKLSGGKRFHPEWS